MEYQKAYEYLIKSLTDRWGQMITEGSKLAEQALSNPDDLSVLPKINEITIKVGLMRDIVCFIETTLERAKQGEI